MTDDVHDRLVDIERRLAISEANDQNRRVHVDFQFASSARAIDVALAANDRRMDGMNEFRGALTDMSNKMITRTEVEARTSSMAEKLGTEIEAVRLKVEQSDRPNYMAWISGISASLIIVGGLWQVTGLKIENAIGPLVVAQEQFRVSQVAQDRQVADVEGALKGVVALQQTDTAKIGVSENDRAQLNGRIRDVERESIKHDDLYHTEMTDLRTMITRLNVWSEFLHGKVFPETPMPPIKQP